MLAEAKRISALFPGLLVVPLLFSVNNDRLYWLFDWLMEVAPKDDVTVRHRTKLIGTNTIGIRKIKL